MPATVILDFSSLHVTLGSCPQLNCNARSSRIAESLPQGSATRKTLLDSNYELPASRGLTRKRPWKLTPDHVQVGAANSAGINTHDLIGGFLNFWLSHVI